MWFEGQLAGDRAGTSGKRTFTASVALYQNAGSNLTREIQNSLLFVALLPDDAMRCGTRG